MANVKLKNHRVSGPLLLRREFGIEGDAKAIQGALFPKKSFAAKAMKSITPVEEPEAPEEVAEETIDYSKYTVKQLREMLEERGLSTDGKKAELVERMSGAE